MKLEWGKNIRNYLEKRDNLAGVVQLLDIRHRPTQMDISLYGWLKQAGIPLIHVATKADKLSKSQAGNQLTIIRQSLELEGQRPLVLFSAKTGQGRDEVWNFMAAEFLSACLPELKLS
jgi:GTP-binding protein